MSESMPRRVGVREVALAAGVSTQTVSRVLNDSPNIRPETRQRVREAMQQLDYRLNNAARSLGTRTTRTIGVIASDTNLYGPSVAIAAIWRAAREVEHWVATAYADATDIDSVVEAGRRLLAQGVDGILVVAAHPQSLQALRQLEVPVAALHTDDGATAQAVGAGLAIKHLLTLGHTRIARIAGPTDWVESTAREQGMREALARADVRAGPSWSGDWSAAAGRMLAGRVHEELCGGRGAGRVRDSERVTAIAVANDQMALGLIAGLRAAGWDVPGQLSVTGFDDNPDAAHYLPALTTVRVDLASEARRAVHQALGLPAPAVRDPELVIRASAGPPPTS